MGKKNKITTSRPPKGGKKKNHLVHQIEVVATKSKKKGEERSCGKGTFKDYTNEKRGERKGTMEGYGLLTLKTNHRGVKGKEPNPKTTRHTQESKGRKTNTLWHTIRKKWPKGALGAIDGWGGVLIKRALREMRCRRPVRGEEKAVDDYIVDE